MPDNYETVKIVYVDDDPQLELSKYLDNYHSDECKVESMPDYIFSQNQSYVALLNDSRIKEANIIIIDSALFQRSSSATNKFSGEEFKIILRKFLPYIEVIVVTQNDNDEGLVMVPKYNEQKHKEKTAFEYYKNQLKEPLDNAVSNVLDYKKIEKKMKDNDALESVLVEKITNLLDGAEMYNELTKRDIDTFVQVFKEVQETINERL